MRSEGQGCGFALCAQCATEPIEFRRSYAARGLVTQRITRSGKFTRGSAN